MDMFKIWRDGAMDVDSHVVGFPVVFITKKWGRRYAVCFSNRKGCQNLGHFQDPLA